VDKAASKTLQPGVGVMPNPNPTIQTLLEDIQNQIREIVPPSVSSTIPSPPQEIIVWDANAVMLEVVAMEVVPTHTHIWKLIYPPYVAPR